MSTTPHVLSTGDFLQDWSDTGLIGSNDDWSGVPAIVGYLGDIDAGSPTNLDARTLTGADLGAVDVIANQSNTTITNGGVAEFDGIADPTVALQGSGTADAPSLVIHLDATGRKDVVLSFDARDIDGSSDNAAQQIAVQYRLGGNGAWTNVDGGYAADVTTGGSATQVTPFTLTLPEEAQGRADLQVRILTTNAAGSDEWVGIDNIKVTSAAAAEAQQVGFSADSLALSVAEGHSGTKLLTFTVERTGGTTGAVSFEGVLDPGATDAADIASGLVFSGVIAAGETSATVTVEINGDTEVEPDETFSLTLSQALNSASVATAILSARASATGTIVNDDAAAGNVIGGITILDMAESLQGSVETPEATGTLAVTRRGSWLSGDGAGGSESITFDDTTARAYVTNAASDRIEVLDLTNPFAPVKVDAIDLSTLPGYGEVNSVAAHDGLIAVAVQNADGGKNGIVALYDSEGTLLKTIEVGVLPDQVTFSPDGKLLTVANEGEPYKNPVTGEIVNASGSVSIIDLSGGAAAASVRNTIGFTALDGFETQLSALGIKIYGGSADLAAPTASQDIEPEYVAISPDGTKAYVTLQEVNAVAVIDLTDTSADKPVSILPAGFVDFSLPGNEADFSDRDGPGGAASISVGNAPVKGLLQPDAIAAFEVDGSTYFITANEGDSRIVNNGADGLNEKRASAFGITDADYARYNLDTTWTTSADDLYGFGGRGFSIFKQNADGTIEKVEETGGDFEQILSALPNASTVFNGENGGSFDTRSDNKGAEPEGVTVGEVNGKTYAFVGLERIGGVMVWDVSTPSDAKFVNYLAPTSDDYGPEVIKFVSAEESPTGRAFLMTANEVSGSVTVYDLEDPGVTKISAIQGEGATSGMVGQTVTVEAIVVGDFQNGDGDASRNLNGFYLQEEIFDEDGNPLTSEGIFVFGGTGDVNIGDRVRVTATVSEYFGMTQLNASTIEVIEAGAVEDINTMAKTISLPAVGVTQNQDGDWQPDLEAYEGMLVTFEQQLTITEQFNLDRFNEIKLVAGDRPAQFTQDNAPDQAGYAAYLQQIGARTITYDDGLNIQNGAINNLDGFGPNYNTANAPRMGDTVTGLTGVLDYQWGGNAASGSTWRVRAVENGANTFEEGTAREEAPADVGGRLKVASLNVLNYFTTIDTIADSSNDQPGDNTALGFDPRGADTAEEFARQTEKLVGTILTLDPDVLALVEIENDFLPGSSGNALEYLVNELNAELGAQVYSWVDPGTQFVGGDAIAVGFIYKPTEVKVAYGTTIEILDDSDLSGLGLQGLIDQSTVGGVFTGTNTSRAALAVTFEEVATGETFTAVANHLKSKSGTGTGADADQLDGQGAWQQQRELAATALSAWAASDPTGSGDKDVLLLGDFNAYFKEDVVGILKNAGYENLQERLENPYSYVFDGQTGSLDYIFSSSSMSSQVTGVTHWQINADEADALDYNTDFGRDPNIFDANSPVRVSDHDPIIIGLDLAEEKPVASYTLQLLHFSDAEAGQLASSTAPNLAALVDAFDDDYANTLVLSSGDNWIPGPFLAAGTDPAVRDAINKVTGSTMTGTIPLGAADVAILGAIGVQATALGNHDLDLGSNALAAALTPGSGWVGAQYVTVSANLVVGPSSPYYTNPTATDSALNGIYVDTLDFNVQPGLNQAPTTTAIAEASTLKGKLVPATIITEGGEKIGIVGATTQLLESISSPAGTEVAGFPGGAGANGEVDDMDLLAAQLQPIIDEMIAEGVNKIILQSHLQQIGNEIALASKLKGVDIIMAGGSNTRMGDADDVPAEFPGHSADFELNYPYLATDANGNPTLIVNTDGEYTYLGRLVVDFDADGNIIVDSLTENTAINGAYAATDENVAEAWNTTVDKLGETAFAEGTKGGDVKTITDAVQGVIDVKDGNVYGYSNVYLEGERSQVRNQETNLGNLTADANGASLASALKGALGNEAEGAYVVSIKNGGGIRAQIGTIATNPDGTVVELPPEGGVSQLDVENSLRFDNKLMAFDTTAEGLKNILEHGVASYGNQGRFPQIGGVAFSFDPDAPAGSRVSDIALIDADGNTLVQLYDDGVLLSDVPSTISVITLNFMADGGDGYPMKANGTNFRYVLSDGTLGPVLDPASDLDANPPANALGEQAALERYMRENHGTEETAYDQADTEMAGDTRIQNMNARAEDTVLDAEAVRFSGNASADVVEGGAEDDVLSGNAGNDILKGHGGDDLIRGGAGDDLIFGGTGNDILLGGAGNDEIYGGDQDDEIEGGRGDDKLVGGNGSDTYSYEAGDGSDTIVEGAGLEGDQDRLVFQDIDSDQVSFGLQGNDVVIRLEDGSVITLKNQADGSGGLEEIAFADGETLDRQAILASIENSPPLAADDTLDPVAEDAAAFEIAFADLLENDEDADGDTLTVTSVKNAVGGIVELTATGVRFTPAANFNGTASFTYLVSDGEGGSAEAKASFAVTPVNDAPVATDDTGSAGENEAKLFDLIANDTDVDGDALSLAGFQVTSVSGIALSNADAANAFSISGGKLAFNPGTAFDALNDGQTATVKLAYTVSDGKGGTDVGEFVLSVAGQSDHNVITGTDRAFETLRGTAGDDLIDARGGNDTVRAGRGNDILLGGAGNDTLYGEDGNDRLDGGAGNDRLTGGAGNDTFVFREGYGRDTVTDFRVGTDIIELSADDFADFDALYDSGAISGTGFFFFRSTQITLDDGSQLVLNGVNASSLSADDFRFV